ncbi:MAG: hypothetical protein ACYTGL_08995 [Planctomycetota bacterium]|jgi:hypothetical protein
MKWMLTSLLLAGVFTGSVCADDPLSQKQRKPIEFSTSITRDELVAAPLDSQVYASASEDLSDLRVIDGDGNAVPFLIRKQRTTEPRITRRSWKAEDLSARPAGDGYFRILVSLDEDDPQPTHIRLVTPLSDFEQQVSVFALDEEGEVLEQVVEDALIFDYAAVVDARRDVIALPSGDARHFRIDVRAMAEDAESPYLSLTRTIYDNKETSRQERTLIRRRPFRIDRIEWILEESHARTKEIVSVDWSAEMAEPIQDEDENQTLIEIRTHRQPISSFEIQTQSRNFSRTVLVEIPKLRAGLQDWEQIGTGAVRQFSIRDLEEEEIEVGFPESRSDTFRMIIENRDSPPLEISKVIARGPVHEAVFLASPEREYSLVYEADVEAPDYDLAAINRLLHDGAEPIVAELSDQQERKDADPAAFDLKDILNNAYVLGSIAVVLIALLGWALFSASKRIQDVEESR